MTSRSSRRLLYRSSSLFSGANREFYSTWQEAGEAARKLGIRTSRQYWAKHSADNKLPHDPDDVYADFPNWPEFLGNCKKTFYPSWQEASAASQKLGIKSGDDYREAYKADPKLHSSPDKYYGDFPGWLIFLGKYATWKQARLAAQRLGITAKLEYKKRHNEDPRLPGDPSSFYKKDFPGWDEFLGKEKKSLYKTWHEAAAAIRRLGITSSGEYEDKRKDDPRLPSALHYQYADFPGWPAFRKEKT